ncbi:hypothetical protein [Agrilactobacillus composti]|uniref:hypothetical protein n=1 Tax=Agrilactobacillus composti TaxID=398555 RepID=UPI001F18AB40|nr:hypothetical protein [Agrilactobacillus composti]
MAPAKLNLAVDITGQYPDGAFQWQMVSTTLNLFDYVRIKVRDDQQIIVSANQSYVPAGKRNLAFQAARLLQQKYQVAKGAEIDIEKHIPWPRVWGAVVVMLQRYCGVKSALASATQQANVGGSSIRLRRRCAILYLVPGGRSPGQRQ